MKKKNFFAVLILFIIFNLSLSELTIQTSGWASTNTPIDLHYTEKASPLFQAYDLDGDGTDDLIGCQGQDCAKIIIWSDFMGDSTKYEIDIDDYSPMSSLTLLGVDYDNNYFDVVKFRGSIYRIWSNNFTLKEESLVMDETPDMIYLVRSECGNYYYQYGLDTGPTPDNIYQLTFNYNDLSYVGRSDFDVTTYNCGGAPGLIYFYTYDEKLRFACRKSIGDRIVVQECSTYALSGCSQIAEYNGGYEDTYYRWFMLTGGMAATNHFFSYIDNEKYLCRTIAGDSTNETNGCLRLSDWTQEFGIVLSNDETDMGISHSINANPSGEAPFTANYLVNVSIGSQSIQLYNDTSSRVVVNGTDARHVWHYNSETVSTQTQTCDTIHYFVAPDQSGSTTTNLTDLYKQTCISTFIPDSELSDQIPCWRRDLDDCELNVSCEYIEEKDTCTVNDVVFSGLAFYENTYNAEEVDASFSSDDKPNVFSLNGNNLFVFNSDTSTSNDREFHYIEIVNYKQHSCSAVATSSLVEAVAGVANDGIVVEALDYSSQSGGTVFYVHPANFELNNELYDSHFDYFSQDCDTDFRNNLYQFAITTFNTTEYTLTGSVNIQVEDLDLRQIRNTYALEESEYYKYQNKHSMGGFKYTVNDTDFAVLVRMNRTTVENALYVNGTVGGGDMLRAYDMLALDLPETSSVRNCDIIQGKIQVKGFTTLNEDYTHIDNYVLNDSITEFSVQACDVQLFCKRVFSESSVIPPSFPFSKFVYECKEEIYFDDFGSDLLSSSYVRDDIYIGQNSEIITFNLKGFDRRNQTIYDDPDVISHTFYDLINNHRIVINEEASNASKTDIHVFDESKPLKISQMDVKTTEVTYNQAATVVITLETPCRDCNYRVFLGDVNQTISSIKLRDAEVRIIFTPNNPVHIESIPLIVNVFKNGAGDIFIRNIEVNPQDDFVCTDLSDLPCTVFCNTDGVSSAFASGNNCITRQQAQVLQCQIYIVRCKNRHYSAKGSYAPYELNFEHTIKAYPKEFSLWFGFWYLYKHDCSFKWTGDFYSIFPVNYKDKSLRKGGLIIDGIKQPLELDMAKTSFENHYFFRSRFMPSALVDAYKDYVAPDTGKKLVGYHIIYSIGRYKVSCDDGFEYTSEKVRKLVYIPEQYIILFVILLFVFYVKKMR